MQNEIKNCQNCKNDFIIEKEDFSFYEKMQVPPPTFCPDCRFQRRFMTRNNRVFYKTECKLCGKSILCLYNKKQPFTIYCKDCWLSDKWNPMDYGKMYNFNVPFFKQFRDLQIAVPKPNLYQTNFVNSEYCNYGLDYKDCYLTFGGRDNERVYFSNQTFETRDSFDIAFCEKIEFCYELFECERANKLFFSSYCIDCIDSYYLIDCRNCINCFGCIGLVNKQYHIFNQPYTKKEYFEFIENNNIGAYSKHIEFLKKVNELSLALPKRYARIYKSINSDGDDLAEAKNTHYAFTCREIEDCKFMFLNRHGSKNCYDINFQGYNVEFSYEITNGFGGSNSAFGIRNFFNQNAFYCEECQNCSNIFGCEGLKKKEYCIFNKQYSREEYGRLLPQIIKHMKEIPYVDSFGRIYRYGEFFPHEISPFSYNESIAQEYYPVSKEEAIKQGYPWQEEDARNYKVDIENKDIPDSIQDVAEDIINKVIACEHGGMCKEQCTEAFKIVPEEFKFYKRMSLPLPRLCPNCRHYKRINQRNPLKLWDRGCMCKKDNHFHGNENCQIKFKTSYAPERPEMVYCEKCYQQEIY